MVQGGASVGIAGFIISGNAPKEVLIRGIGPSLTAFGVPNALANPALLLNGPNGFPPVSNNNWKDTQQAAIEATGAAPTNDLESAILVTLIPGSYTAIISGQDGGTGVGLVELYDRTPNSDSKLGNISTRAFVNTGADIVIAGFILGNGVGADNLVVRGIGPSLTDFGVPNALSDPTLEVRNANGTPVSSNDNWMDDPNHDSICRAALAPTNNSESALYVSLAPGSYTALLSGVNNTTGVGLVEVFDNPSLGNPPCPTPAPTPTPSPSPIPQPCTENFDGVTAPTLPNGWSASNIIAGDGALWTTTTTIPDSGNNAFIPDQPGRSDKVLVSRNITATSASATLTFHNNYITRSNVQSGLFLDGGVLEVSAPMISNGDWLDITDSLIGGTFPANGYTGTLSNLFGNPLQGRMAWSGDSGGYITTTVNLGSGLNGKTFQLRFRLGTDTNTVAAQGWHIDNLVFTNAICP